MTTNDATPREALMNVLDVYLPDWVDELGYQADSVVAHLWRMADDPAVVEAALDAAEAANDLYPLDGEPNSVWQARYFSASFAAFLEQLIGPRPTEQESNDE